MKAQYMVSVGGQIVKVKFLELEKRTITEEIKIIVSSVKHRRAILCYHAEVEVEGVLNPTVGGYAYGSTPDMAVEFALENFALAVPF